MNLTDIVKDIRVYKKGDLNKDPRFYDVFSNFSITQYISMFDDCHEVVMYCNLFQTIWSKDQMYNFLLQTVPKHNRFYVNYIAKSKEKEK